MDSSRRIQRQDMQTHVESLSPEELAGLSNQLFTSGLLEPVDLAMMSAIADQQSSSAEWLGDTNTSERYRVVAKAVFVLLLASNRQHNLHELYTKLYAEEVTTYQKMLLGTDTGHNQ